jgi:hypothetical protein
MLEFERHLSCCDNKEQTSTFQPYEKWDKQMEADMPQPLISSMQSSLILMHLGPLVGMCGINAVGTIFALIIVSTILVNIPQITLFSKFQNCVNC